MFLTHCTKLILEQCSKANKMLDFINRSTRNIACTSARRTLYLTLVRSQVGNAAQVWSPKPVDRIRRLERAQRRASKFILGFLCDASYDERVKQLNLPISYWHEYLDMMFLFKANCGAVNLPSSVLST